MVPSPEYTFTPMFMATLHGQTLSQVALRTVSIPKYNKSPSPFPLYTFRQI